MNKLLRTLAFPTACAFTGAAAGLLATYLVGAFTPTCPQALTPGPAAAAVAFADVQAAPPAPMHAPAAPLPEGAVRCPAEDHCIVSRAVLDGLFNDPREIEAQAKIMPWVKGEQVLGFKLYGVRPGSLPKLLGLRNGDAVIAADGAALASMADALAVVQRLRTADSVDLEIERKGQRQRLRVDLE